MTNSRFPLSALLTLAVTLASSLAPQGALAQGLTPSTLLKPPADSWPTYNGDYSGRRFSSLTQIDSSNVHTLSLAWATRFTAAPGTGGGGGVQIKSTPCW